MTWCRYCGERLVRGPADGEWWTNKPVLSSDRYMPWECERCMPPADPKLRIGMTCHIHHVPNAPNDTEEQP